MLRVILLGPYPAGTGGSLRYRWEQYIPSLRACGIELDIRGFQTLRLFEANQYAPSAALRTLETAKSLTRRLQDAKDAIDYDLVIVQREAIPLGPPIIERWLARQGKKLVYDFDDALYVRAGRPIKRLIGWSQKIAEIIELSRHTIAGNPTLGNFARQHTDRVTIIPTVPFPDVYRIPDRPSPEEVSLGWSGGRNNSSEIQGIAPAIQKLSQEQAVRLQVAGDAAFSMPGVRTSGSDWHFPVDDGQVWSALREFDMGLMPLADNEWNRGKCGFKALLYMSMGIPPVVSPVGINSSIIQHGVNGFLASTDHEWHDALRALTIDADLRHRIGEEARRTVEQRWSAHQEVERVANVLLEAAS